MAEASSRVLWKGAITFGLVHIPVGLHSATAAQGIDFDWLDKRTMDRVGYKRINKKTGKEIDKENIVKGIAYEDGQYVVLSDEEIAQAYPRTTQTIEIEAFVGADEIPFVYLERPYYVAPINKGAKVYALLRETLIKTGKIGVARVVIQTKQHLAALIPSGRGMVLNLLRWGEDIRPNDELDLPPEGTKASGINDRELKMAQQLVQDMSARWDPAQYRDEFKDAIMVLVEKRVKAGQTETVSPLEDPADGNQGGAQVIDLTELLKRSLKKPGAAAGKSAVSKKADDDDSDDAVDGGDDSATAPKKKSAQRASAAKGATTATSKSTAKAVSANSSPVPASSLRKRAA